MHPHVLDMLYFSFAQPIDSKHIADSPRWDMCDTASLRYSASLNAALRQWFRYRLMLLRLHTVMWYGVHNYEDVALCIFGVHLSCGLRGVYQYTRTKKQCIQLTKKIKISGCK